MTSIAERRRLEDDLREREYIRSLISEMVDVIIETADDDDDDDHQQQVRMEEGLDITKTADDGDEESYRREPVEEGVNVVDDDEKRREASVVEAAETFSLRGYESDDAGEDDSLRSESTEMSVFRAIASEVLDDVLNVVVAVDGESETDRGLLWRSYRKRAGEGERSPHATVSRFRFAWAKLRNSSISRCFHDDNCSFDLLGESDRLFPRPSSHRRNPALDDINNNNDDEKPDDKERNGAERMEEMNDDDDSDGCSKNRIARVEIERNPMLERMALDLYHKRRANLLFGNYERAAETGGGLFCNVCGEQCEHRLAGVKHVIERHVVENEGMKDILLPPWSQYLTRRSKGTGSKDGAAKAADEAANERATGSPNAKNDDEANPGTVKSEEEKSSSKEECTDWWQCKLCKKFKRGYCTAFVHFLTGCKVAQGGGEEQQFSFYDRFREITKGEYFYACLKCPVTRRQRKWFVEHYRAKHCDSVRIAKNRHFKIVRADNKSTERPPAERTNPRKSSAKDMTNRSEGSGRKKRPMINVGLIPKWKCRVCDREFEAQPARYHLKSSCRLERPTFDKMFIELSSGNYRYSCRRCDKKFSSFSYFFSHFQWKHERRRNFIHRRGQTFDLIPCGEKAKVPSKCDAPALRSATRRFKSKRLASLNAVSVVDDLTKISKRCLARKKSVALIVADVSPARPLASPRKLRRNLRSSSHSGPDLTPGCESAAVGFSATIAERVARVRQRDESEEGMDDVGFPRASEQATDYCENKGHLPNAKRLITKRSNRILNSMANSGDNLRKSSLSESMKRLTSSKGKPSSEKLSELPNGSAPISSDEPLLGERTRVLPGKRTSGRRLRSQGGRFIEDGRKLQKRKGSQANANASPTTRSHTASTSNTPTYESALPLESSLVEVAPGPQISLSETSSSESCTRLVFAPQASTSSASTSVDTQRPDSPALLVLFTAVGKSPPVITIASQEAAAATPIPDPELYDTVDSPSASSLLDAPRHSPTISPNSPDVTFDDDGEAALEDSPELVATSVAGPSPNSSPGNDSVRAGQSSVSSSPGKDTQQADRVKNSILVCSVCDKIFVGKDSAFKLRAHKSKHEVATRVENDGGDSHRRLRHYWECRICRMRQESLEECRNHLKLHGSFNQARIEVYFKTRVEAANDDPAPPVVLIDESDKPNVDVGREESTSTARDSSVGKTIDDDVAPSRSQSRKSGKKRKLSEASSLSGRLSGSDASRPLTDSNERVSDVPCGITPKAELDVVDNVDDSGHPSSIAFHEKDFARGSTTPHFQGRINDAGLPGDAWASAPSTSASVHSTPFSPRDDTTDALIKFTSGTKIEISNQLSKSCRFRCRLCVGFEDRRIHVLLHHVIDFHRIALRSLNKHVSGFNDMSLRKRTSVCIECFTLVSISGQYDHWELNHEETESTEIFIELENVAGEGTSASTVSTPPSAATSTSSFLAPPAAFVTPSSSSSSSESPRLKEPIAPSAAKKPKMDWTDCVDLTEGEDLQSPSSSQVDRKSILPKPMADGRWPMAQFETEAKIAHSRVIARTCKFRCHKCPHQSRLIHQMIRHLVESHGLDIHRLNSCVSGYNLWIDGKNSNTRFCLECFMIVTDADQHFRRYHSASSWSIDNVYIGLFKQEN